MKCCKIKEVDMEEKQKQYKVVGIAMFVVASLLLWMRVLVGFISREIAKTSLAEWAQELLTDLLFTVPLQVGVLFLLVFFIYKKGLKKSAREIFSTSGFKKPEGKKVVLAVLIGIFGYFATVGISAVWSAIIETLGYKSSSSAMILPDEFNIGVFLLSMFITAVLPAFCEEFAMRGMFTKTLDNSFSDKTVIILGGIAFGLFHQYIEQLLYTALFGMLITYIMLRTGCIWYGVIIHFVNNGISVFLSFASKYNFIIGPQIFEIIGRVATSNAGVLLVYAFFGVMAIVTYLLARALAPRKKRAYDANGNMILGKLIYQPCKKDNIWYIGAIVMTALVTVFTFLFGYLQ